MKIVKDVTKCDVKVVKAANKFYYEILKYAISSLIGMTDIGKISK